MAKSLNLEQTSVEELDDVLEDDLLQFDEDVSLAVPPIQNFISVDPLPVSKYKDLQKLRINYHQDRNLANSSLRTVHALDTETDSSTGNIILIGDEQGNRLRLDEINLDSLTKFLFSKRYQGTWNFFWNLNFDAEVTLKELKNELYRYKNTGKLNFEYDNYRFDYIPSKKLSIQKGHKSAVFFDIAQYFKAALADAYQNNIGSLPDDYLKMKIERESFTKRYYERNIKYVEYYHLQDCVYTKRLADLWIDVFYRACNFYPSRWVSSGYLAEKWLYNSKINIPRFDCVDYNVQDIAWKSYYGGRFEMLKRGFIGQTFVADINSAYPYAIANIPDITKGKWKNLKHLDKTAILGFFEIECNIPDTEYVTPFPFRTKTNKIIFPSGNFKTWVTLAELQVCSDHSWYRILDSWQYFDNNPIYPYKNFIQEKFNLRLKFKREKNPLELALKTLLNSIYGKTAQSNQGKNLRFGNIFNPVIASTITGISRALLYATVKKYNLDRYVVSFATDSIMSTRLIPINDELLGSFKQEEIAYDTYVLQNGIIRRNDWWKNRGIGSLKGLDVEHIETVEKNGQVYIVLKPLRVNRLRSCIKSNTIQDIGKFQKIERKINLNADRKRIWIDNLEKIDDGKMCDSLSIILGNPALTHLL